MKIFWRAFCGLLLFGCLGITPSFATVVTSSDVVNIDFDLGSGHFDLLHLYLPVGADDPFGAGDGFTATTFENPSPQIGSQSFAGPAFPLFSLAITPTATWDGRGSVVLSNISGSFNLLTDNILLIGECTGTSCRPVLSITPPTSVSISTVPLPAALPLFLSMLSGVGFLRWRRRKALSA